VNPLYPDVAERAEKRCEYCRAPEQVFNFAFEVEHVEPRSAGGGDSSDNLALACASCNSYKAVARSGRDKDTGQRSLLFHPRRDRWSDHFRFDSETGLVQGTTPKGRVTVAQLKMNPKFQIRARQQWIQLEIYP